MPPLCFPLSPSLSSSLPLPPYSLFPSLPLFIPPLSFPLPLPHSSPSPCFSAFIHPIISLTYSQIIVSLEYSVPSKSVDVLGYWWTQYWAWPWKHLLLREYAKLTIHCTSVLLMCQLMKGEGLLYQEIIFCHRGTITAWLFDIIKIVLLLMKVSLRACYLGPLYIACQSTRNELRDTFIKSNTDRLCIGNLAHCLSFTVHVQMSWASTR